VLEGDLLIQPPPELDAMLDLASQQIQLDSGNLDSRVRKKLYLALRESASDSETFRLFQLRLGVLSVQTLRACIEIETPHGQLAVRLLDRLTSLVDQGRLKEIHALVEDAETLFGQLEILKCDRRNKACLDDKPGKDSLYAAAAVAQIIKLDDSGLEDRWIHRYYTAVEPFYWMPEFWAAVSHRGGAPRASHGRMARMIHFWRWYLDEGIPRALVPDLSVCQTGFTPLSQEDELLRFARPLPKRPPESPLYTRFSFFDGYVEKRVSKRGRTTSMVFYREGVSCGTLSVNYSARTGEWTDDNYMAETYRRGHVESIHLGELASARQDVPIDEWVSSMEHQLLRFVSTYKFLHFMEWAEKHWDTPFQPEKHLDDIQHCYESYCRLFQEPGRNVEDTTPFVQAGWSLLAIALGKEQETATTLIHRIWPEVKDRYGDYLATIRQLMGERGIRVL